MGASVSKIDRAIGRVLNSEESRYSNGPKIVEFLEAKRERLEKYSNPSSPLLGSDEFD